jgi:hypothetical protein
VEAPLFRLEGLIEKLELIRVRIDAAVKVWPEVGRTLNPALCLVDSILQDLRNLKDALAVVWREGFEVNWK